MITLLAAAALTACMGGHAHDGAHHQRCTGFAPDIDNGFLATHAPEESNRVYTPGSSDLNGRLWVGSDVKDVRGRRASHHNPGRLAYGAAGAGHEQVKLKVGSLVVSISPWQLIEGEGWSNFENGRQQWLAERGYTGGVRTFVNPSRVRAMQAETHASGHADRSSSDAECTDVPEPIATIRLRRPKQTGGVIKGVDAGVVAGGLRIVSSGGPIRVSLPATARAELVEMVEARGWVEPTETETRVVAAD